MKHSILLFILLFLVVFCKEKTVSRDQNEEDPFFIATEKGCVLNTSKSNSCVNTKEEFSCYKTLNELKKSSLDKIFFNKVWMGNDQQTLFYNIDSIGDIKIFEGGPDRLPDQRILVGIGKFYSVGNQWYFEQSCIRTACEQIKIPVLFLECTLTTNLSEDEVLRYLEFGNRKSIDDDEKENDKSYKSISFIQEKSVPNQILNFFISTPFPPRPAD